MHENGTLEIKRVQPEDQGTYTFVASNILGKAEDQVRLEVKGEGFKMNYNQSSLIFEWVSLHFVQTFISSSIRLSTPITILSTQRLKKLSC